MLTSEGHLVLAVAAPTGQHLKEFGELALAFALSSLIGLEREWRQKSAGPTLEVRGQPRVEPLVVALDEFDGVLEVASTDVEDDSD